MMEPNTYKIAVVTNNGATVSQHYGSSKKYEVFTIENGRISDREEREKFNAHTPGEPHHHNHAHESYQMESAGGFGSGANRGLGNASGYGNGFGHNHGAGHHSEDKHNSMIGNIKDCKYLVAGGMGYGIYTHLQNAQIEPIISDIHQIVDAVHAIIDGTIINHAEKLH
ncbi:MAG: hypothetical protein QG635_306 [Bacteroidota bacterium]|nr:hypothetical protein [Bacteroidota bacterium]